MADFPLGLSFDDVLLLPRLSAILPGDADISSQLVPGFDMKIPVLSAAMDTVSESELAIALAREGGLAVIHRNNPIDIQAAMVSRVKRFENAVIPNPVTVNKDMTLEEVHQIMMDQGYSGFPVVDANRKLEGIITVKDIATANMDVFDTGVLATSRTTYKNILDALFKGCIPLLFS